MRKSSNLLAMFFLSFAVPAAAQVDTETPATARDFYARGLKREEAKRFQEAIADYRQAAALDSEFFDAHFTLSSLYAELEDYRAALEALAKSLEARPKDHSALFNSGLYHENLHEYDDAIGYYTQAAADDADFSHYGGSTEEARAHALHYRGRVYQWHKQDNVRALADFTAALRLDPDIEMVRYRRARVYHDLKAYPQAHAEFAAARESDPDYPNLLNAWAWQLATCPIAKYRDGQMALQLATQTKDPETLAAAYAELGEFDDAIGSQRRAIEQLDDRAMPRDEQAAERRNQRREQLRKRLAVYEARRPYRDE